MTIVRCMKPNDAGDGVTFFCGLFFKHVGPCEPNTAAPFGGIACGQPDKNAPSRTCFRVKYHHGPCKFAP